jgi:hypothetical protein
MAQILRHRKTGKGLDLIVGYQYTPMVSKRDKNDGQPAIYRNFKSEFKIQKTWA